MAIDIEKMKIQLKETSVIIDNEIEKLIPKERNIPNLYDAFLYAIGSGGKRLRPFLCLETCRRLEGEAEKAMPFAVACEVLHNWLLVHDDIQDGDTIRRDKPSVWIKYGLGHGVNVGDNMAHKVFESILKSREKGVDNETIFKLLKLMTDTAVKTSEGQAMEMNLRTKNDFTEQEYLDMIMLKTGYYLVCPIVGGAIVAGANENIIKKIFEYGNYIGPAFQIRDDIIDLTEGKGRGQVGSDIREGKRSIVVVYALRKCNAEERKKLLEILNKPRGKTSDKDVEWAIKLFEKHGAINSAQNKAKEFLEKSRQIIKDMPQGIKEGLEMAAEFIVERKV